MMLSLLCKLFEPPLFAFLHLALPWCACCWAHCLSCISTSVCWLGNSLIWHLVCTADDADENLDGGHPGWGTAEQGLDWVQV